MKKKILLWIDFVPLHFALAYYLQKTNDYELYAIIDITNKPKKFFLEQKLVNFKKVWFFHDNIKNFHVPDLQYLSTVEKKYDINLWKLAINERIFYRFYDFHKFSSNEIMSIEEDACRLYEEVLDNVKPEYFFTYLPNLHHLQLLYEICNSKKIRTLVLSNPILGYKTRIAEGREIQNSQEKLKTIKGNGRSFKEMIEYLHSFNISKQLKESFNDDSNLKLLNSAIEFLFRSDNKHEKTHYTYFGRTKIRVLLHTLNISIKKKIRARFMLKNFKTEIDTHSPFVYYPLGVDPEANILITAPFYTNQIEVIRNVAKSLPMGCNLYVKENPAQTNREWRSISEYKEIMNIPNVTLLHPSVSNEKLLKNSSLVVTIAGTSGFEAAFYQKPSIIFADTIYSILPSVHRVTNIEELPSLIRKCFSENVNEHDLDKFLTMLEEDTFDFDLRGFNSKILEHFFNDGHLHDMEISEKDMKNFLEQNESSLQILTQEHTKKMNNEG